MKKQTKQDILILGFSRVGEGGSNKDRTRMNGWLSYCLRIRRTARQQNKTVIYVCFYFFVYNSMEWMDGMDGMGWRKQSIKQGLGGKETGRRGHRGSNRERGSREEDEIRRGNFFILSYFVVKRTCNRSLFKSTPTPTP